MNSMRSTLSDFLDDNLPYNYRPRRVKIALTYTIASSMFIREITFFISSLSNSYILLDGRVITPWLRCVFMCLESTFRSEKLETPCLNLPISGFLHLWEAAQTWRYFFSSTTSASFDSANKKSIINYRIKRSIFIILKF